MDHMNSKHHLNNVHSKLSESSTNLFQKHQQQLKQQLTKPEEPTNDCCLLAHRDYFNLDAYHSKIIERSLQSNIELKCMKLKQTNFKAEIKKSNQMLKSLKQEYDKKQSILNDLNKSSTGLNDKLNFFKRFIQTANSLNSETQQQHQQQQQQQQQSANNQEQITYLNKTSSVQQSQQNLNLNQPLKDNNFINSVIFINPNDPNTNIYQQQQPIHQIQQQQQLQQSSVYSQQQFQQQPVQFINYINQQQQPQQMLMMQQQQQQQQQQAPMYLNDQFSLSNYVISNNQQQQQ